MKENKRRYDEILRYVDAYKKPEYKLGRFRKVQIEQYLKDLPVRGSFLDVGTGRGETLQIAEGLGYSPVQGLDPVNLDVPNVIQGIATDLPFADKSFDLVTMFDVIEHLIEEDIKPAVEELIRVSKRYVIVTAHTKQDHQGLHISYRSHEKWHELLKSIHPVKVLDCTMNDASGGYLYEVAE